MRFVYPHRGDGRELRYSLRSLPEGAAPWVIGDIPVWYTGDAISVPERDDYRYTDSTRLLLRYCENHKESFILMNDDYYFLTDDIDRFMIIPYSSKVPSAILASVDVEYSDLLRRTQRQTGCDLNYATHRPVPIIRTLSVEDYMRLCIDKKLSFRIVYGHHASELLPTAKRTDPKLRQPSKKIDNMEFASGSDSWFSESGEKQLKSRFPTKSVWEK